MGLFKRFKKHQPDKTKETNPASIIKDAIGIRQQIKKSTLSLLDALYMSEPKRCVTKRLAVWFDTDGTTFGAYAGFEQELMDYWSVERGYVFESVSLKQGKPGKDGRKVDIPFDGFDVYLQEQVMDYSRPIARKASIVVSGSKGSMQQERYELSSETLNKEHRKFYNIGRGVAPQMEDGSYRQNHIVIDDENNFDVNRFVSRAHARIGYSENIGFYLQVERGGSRLSGNRTRVFRDEETIEVENLDLKVPLRSGDLIELGKAVVLKYEEID